MVSKLRFLVTFFLPLLLRYRKKENRAEAACLLLLALVMVLLEWPAETEWIRKALLDFITLIFGG